MTYRVQLLYFRQTGKFLTSVETTSELDSIVEIWEQMDDLRRLGRLPGLRPSTGRDLFVIVDVLDHPQRVMHMVMPPFHDDDDVTPPRIPTVEMLPLVRMPLEEMPRTSTRDVVRVDPDADTAVTEREEITPVEVPVPTRED